MYTKIETSRIEWTGATWNPWQGCTKKLIEIDGQTQLREECLNCYMYRDKRRYGQRPAVVVRSKPPTFNKPRKWQREVEAGKRKGIDRLVFTSSWTDFFNPEADEWRPEAWQIMRECPGLIFQILTKLTDRIEAYLPPFWDEIKGRVWMGTSAGYQPALDWAAPYLLRIDAGVRFLSCEPLLSELDLVNTVFEKAGPGWAGYNPLIDWVIGGGESGPKARPTQLEWARSLRDQCQAAAVPFFWKQWGEYAPVWQGYLPGLPTGYEMKRIGKKDAGRLLDGVEWSQFPLDRLPEQVADEIRAQQSIKVPS